MVLRGMGDQHTLGFMAASAGLNLAYMKPRSIGDTLTQLAYKQQLDHEDESNWSYRRWLLIYFVFGPTGSTDAKAFAMAIGFRTVSFCATCN